MGSQNRGIIIYRKTMGSQNRKTMGSQNRGIIIQKNNGFTEQRYYNIEKIEVL